MKQKDLLFTPFDKKDLITESGVKHLNEVIWLLIEKVNSLSANVEEKTLKEIFGKDAFIDYERNSSHYHCWNQNKPPACGIPLEKHTQCCLCDTPKPQDDLNNIYWQPCALCGNNPTGCSHTKPNNAGSKGGIGYDSPVYLPNTGENENSKPQEDWEKEFDQKFISQKIGWIGADGSGGGVGMLYKELKKFISTLLHTQQERMKEKVKGMKIKIQPQEGMTERCHGIDLIAEHNKVVDDILQLLNNKE